VSFTGVCKNLAAGPFMGWESLLFLFQLSGNEIVNKKRSRFRPFLLRKTERIVGVLKTKIPVNIEFAGI